MVEGENTVKVQLDLELLGRPSGMDTGEEGKIGVKGKSQVSCLSNWQKNGAIYYAKKNVSVEQVAGVGWIKGWEGVLEEQRKLQQSGCIVHRQVGS